MGVRTNPSFSPDEDDSSSSEEEYEPLPLRKKGLLMIGRTLLLKLKMRESSYHKKRSR